MSTLRIVGFGVLGVTAFLIVVTIHLWRDEARKTQGLKALRELTPETLIAKCGQPTSDTEPLVLHLKVDSDTATNPGQSKEVSLRRLIEYKKANFPYWVKLQFTREIGKGWQPTQWQFAHFASPRVGVSPSAENAYIAIPEFPCIAKQAPYSSP